MSAVEAVAVPRYSVSEEWANGLIHGIGAVLSVVGLILMVIYGHRLGSERIVFSCAVFGATLIALYLASTLYHAIPHAPSKALLRRMDHIAIFLLIAGTYTPFILLVLGYASWGPSLFIGVWLLALAGIVTEFTPLSKRRWVAALLYVGIGWLGLFVFSPMKAHLAVGGVRLLLAGGLTYTVGVPFYLWRRLPYHHAIWHLFVLGGSALHFFAVLLYVMPGAAAVA